MSVAPAASALVVPERPRRRAGTWIALGVVVVITVVTCLPGIGVGLDVAPIVANWRNGATKIVELLTPDWSFFPRTVAPMLETLQMAVLGTVVGAAISLPLSFWAARPTNPQT